MEEVLLQTTRAFLGDSRGRERFPRTLLVSTHSKDDCVSNIQHEGFFHSIVMFTIFADSSV